MNIKNRIIKKYFCLFLAALFLLTTSGTAAPEQAASEEDEFSIAIIPDTQYYTSEKNGGKKEMFFAQTDWIVKNAAKENIRYVIHLGDISDNGEQFPEQWINASQAMYRLETPFTNYPQGMPYGMAVGNHDQTKSQFPLSGITKQYNKYFGISHFEGKKWYGGHYREDNDSHFDLFEGGGSKFIAIFFEYDSYDEDIEPLNKWAAAILEKYSDRKAILVSHSILHFNKIPGTNEKGFPKFSKQGQRIFDRLKSYPNVFLTLSGHVGDNGEGYRQDGYAGNVITSMLSDYQSRAEGGHGLMRLLTFSKSKDLIRVQTFSPFTGEEETDADSKFSFPWKHHTGAARVLDFDNDGLTNVSSFKEGIWKVSGMQDVPFGKLGDVAVPADYNGDGKTDMACFRPDEGRFYFQDGRMPVKLGQKGDIPVCGDWDGDGFAEVAVYRPSNLTWYFNGLESMKFGHKSGVPVPADYDGDGILDVGIFRTDNSMWQTALGNIPLQLKHSPGDLPVPGDYNGDGKAEMALFRPSTCEWLIGFNKSFVFGKPGDLPVPRNYHKDGKTHPGVFRGGKVYLQNGSVVQAPSKDFSELLNQPGVKFLIKNGE
ncbi:metallophosphoesterase [Pedobacter lithocola]|uniref:Metallophosphoesterase n=1 Tax=Pedobacter lithocola TaxID=1908239 RepID=A0ABV8P536_9SPHI